MKGKSRIFLLAAAVSLFFGPTAVGLIMENEDDDPDRPPGIHGPFDEAEYIKAREAFIALRRGNDPDKPLDPTARTRAIEMMDGQVAELQRRSRGPNGANQPLVFPNWVELGPNPIPLGQTTTTRVNVSGRISAIEIDPTDPNKVYVGAAQGGVYRSLDGGTTWTSIFDTAQSLAIGTLNLDPVNGWLWVGTGEANGSADSFGGVGLYRIDNVNTTATLVGPINPIRIYNDGSGNPARAGFFTGRSISKIIRVPGAPNTLFCGVAGGVIGLGGNPPFGNTLPPLAMRGLVRLSNVTGPASGITGTRVPVSTVDTGLGLCLDTPCTVNRSVNDMVLDPQDPSGNTLIVWLNGINVANDGGIYRSPNAMGVSPTFTQTLVTTSTTTSNGRGELRTYARSGTTVIYVASGEPSNVPAGATICNSSTQFGALRRSDDGGATWSAKLAGGGGFCQGQCFYNIGFDVVPGASTATDKLLLGGNVASGNCARQQATSLDGAATTFTTHSATTHADTHQIKIAASNPLVVYRGDDGGVWKSIDGGDTWINQNNTTLKATQFQSIAVHPTDQDITIGGTQDNGTETISASGPVWLHSDDGDGGFAMIDQSTPTTMYHTYFNQTSSQIGYARSLTGGAFGSWSFLGCSGTGTTNGIACSPATTTAVNFYCPTALGPGSPNNTVYIGTDRLLRSDTQGTANVTVSQAPIHSGVAISSIGISLLDDNYRIVGLNNGELWYTTTGSATLTSLDPVAGASVIPDFYVARLAFDPTNKNTVYIALGNYANGTLHTQSHVWRVTNLDTTPVITSLNGTGVFTLPDVPVNGFVVDPLKPTRLFAGTDIGVYLSEDGGLNWFPFGTGLPRVAVFDMAIQNVKRVVRIATHGRGMWEIPIPAFALDAFYRSFPGNTVGSGTVNVTGPSGPTWAATSNDSWIHVTNGGPGTGNGTVTFTVDINPSTTANRSGTMTIALQTFTVYQGAAFLDVPPADPFYDDIGRLSARGITVGCGSGNYCPTSLVLREQMAAFIVRAVGEFSPATPASQRFTDVPPASPFYEFIDRLAVLGITVGCNPPSNTMYCPSSSVTREQMAAFIIRALGEFNPPTPGSQRFNDVPPSNVFYNFIDRMAVLNITLGCTPDHLFYCPTDPVTRAQMAAFLVRAFNL